MKGESEKMRTKKKRKAAMLASILAVMLAVPQVVSAAPAAQSQEDAPLLVVNESTVAFAGHEWWVIGDGTTGVYQQSDSVTLLAKQDEFGKSVFRTGHGNEFEGSTYDSGNKMYYANNPDGTSWVAPTEYAGSTLQLKMDAIAAEFSAKELAAVKDRTLQGGGTVDSPSQDGIAGPAITQKVWSLSKAEWEVINDNTIRSYGDQYLLRTPHSYYGRARKARADGATNYIDSAALAELSVRPALALDLSNVLFTSAADATSGKAAATVGAGLVSVGETTGTVKFTMQDESQTLTVVATNEQSVQTGTTLQFNYSAATTGENQYISCVLTDANGNVKYYAKLADSASAASGALSIPLAGVADGTYTLKLFSEEANGNLYTDFCSAPVNVQVSAGTGTVSEYGGAVVHGHPLVKTDAKAATCTEAGNMEYWYCSQCDQYFSDAQGITSITEEQTVIAAGHNYVEGECTVCGAADPNYIPPDPLTIDDPANTGDPVNTDDPATTGDPVNTDDPTTPADPTKTVDPEKTANTAASAQKPATGDNSSLWIYGLVLALCGGGIATVGVMKKRSHNTK